jgi:energy-converting hydrogenase Eha subunit H
VSRLLKRIAESFRGQVFTRLFFFFILLILASFSMMGFFIRYAVAAIILEKNESYVKNSLFQMRDAFEIPSVR